MDIAEFQQLRAAGRTTALEQTQACRTRIAQVDPLLRAVLCLAPDAEAQARASDERAATGTLRGPLDGVTVLLKDNIDTAELPTTAGSRALADLRAPKDAAIVDRLRAAGAVILGKTNLSEWANFRSTHSISGWSAVGGQTGNPHVLAHNPSGSSSGSAAAVAAGMAHIAIGTETNGSIVSPAGYCGVVGLKPTSGLLPTDGVIPISPHQDAVGVLARTVADAALTLAVLHGVESPARAGLPTAGRVADRDETGLDLAGLAARATPAALRGRRLGIWRRPGDPFVDRVLADSVAALTEAGARCVDVDLPDLDEIDERSWFALVAEFRGALDEYLRTRPGGPACLAEVVAFNRVDPIELSRFDQDIFELALDADPRHRDHRPTATRLARAAIDRTIAAHDLDAVLAPTNGPAEVTGAPGSPIDSATPAAVAGYPAVTVPAGSAGPLPIGITLLSGAHRDAHLLATAAAFERLVQARKDPELHPVLPV
ncbi:MULTISPECIES: amidase family protein [Actinokineospora]|uniref:Amidase n=1 Tax=Actinokineospora fastidiosa TaxID=1816 RepID=A0A918G0I7_9PSEU|nr:MULTISPECIES: amidase family protein [Actinokineospora]UVS77257.1 Glutamyl-tRNA(Gln) amidotransferase subunit A [Actinokineospora sp. UTMC 2448]GGS12425.1 amidase [Actinokineospora fastidiosa]